MSDGSEWWEDLVFLIPPVAQLILAIGLLFLIKPFTLALLIVTGLFAIIAGAVYRLAGKVRGGEMAVGILLFSPAVVIATTALVVFVVVSIVGVVTAI